MPELPEVETVARQLHPKLSKRRILQAKTLDAKLQASRISRIENSTIHSVYRLGKQVIIQGRKDDSDWFLAVHLRMTGRLLWQEREDLSNSRFSKKNTMRKYPHARVLIRCDAGDLVFADTRRFGTIKLANSLDDLKPIGVDPVQTGFSSKKLEQLLGSTSQPLKNWLLRQDKIVGIGNIYASEILFDAGLLPDRRANTLGRDEIAKLRNSTVKILKAAIKNCGTTFSDFQDSTGSVGKYQNYLEVYQREGQECTSCSSRIEKIVQQGRSTFYCSCCQN